MSTPQKIFIVEKNAELLVMLSMILKKQYIVFPFQKADNDFFEQVKNVKPDILVLEWVSHLLNFNEIIHSVRALYGDACKILVMSSMDDAEKILIDKPVDGLLMKPFKLVDLNHQVHDLLQDNNFEETH